MKKNQLLPNRHPQQDFFIAEIFDGIAFKSDVASMEHPMFTLSMKKDLREIDYTSPDGRAHIRISPSMSYGLPNIFDKDILLYCGSIMMAHINKGEIPPRTLQFYCYDLLVTTNRSTSGEGYKAIKKALPRLKGVNIETNIGTADGEITKGFGLIESYELIKSEKTKGRMVAIRITLSEWLYDMLLRKEVLTISKGYFRLRKAIDRSLYQIARKHCGKQKKWSISLFNLQRKTGSMSTITTFRYHVGMLAKTNHLPDYEVFLDKEDVVTFTPKPELVEQGNETVEKDKAQQQSEENAISELTTKTLEKGFAIVKEAGTGWDYDVIQREFFEWSKKKPKANNLGAAFLGFVRRKVKNAPGLFDTNSANTTKEEQVAEDLVEEEKQDGKRKKKDIEKSLKNKGDDYRSLVEVLLRYYPVSYCWSMVCKSRVEPIKIEKSDNHIKCEINGLYLERDLCTILKDLEEVFGCTVDLTIDGSREMSKSLIYTDSFEELKEEMDPIENT
jgi:plasmid replication initiation protein